MLQWTVLLLSLLPLDVFAQSGPRDLLGHPRDERDIPISDGGHTSTKSLLASAQKSGWFEGAQLRGLPILVHQSYFLYLEGWFDPRLPKTRIEHLYALPEGTIPQPGQKVGIIRQEGTLGPKTGFVITSMVETYHEEIYQPAAAVDLVKASQDPTSWKSTYKFRELPKIEVSHYMQTPLTREIRDGKRLTPTEIKALKKPLFRLDFRSCSDIMEDWNQARDQLESVVAYLLSEKNSRIRITGHVNCEGCYAAKPNSPKVGAGPDVWEQSTECSGQADYAGAKVADLMYGRAMTVRDYLIMHHGIDPSRIEIAAGTYQADPSSPEYGNRKVTIDYLD